MAIRYAFIHIRRNALKCLAMVAIVLAFSLLLISINTILLGQQRELGIIMDSLPIEAVVSDIYGTTYDGLSIMPAYIDLLYDENSQLAPFIQDPCIKRSIPGNLLSGNNALEKDGEIQLIGITSLAADPLLREENGVSIQYRDGYDDSIFAGDELVCLVNQSVLDAMGGDAHSLTLSFDRAVLERRKDIERNKSGGAPLSGGEDVGNVQLIIVGTIEGGISNAIYCPWTLIREIDEAIYGNATANAMSFTIADNHRLNEAKTLLRGYFSEVTQGYPISQGGDFTATALIIRDGNLIQSVSPLERSISFLSGTMPFLFALSIGIGFLTSFLFIRSRRAEFALMRGMGTKRMSVFGSAFLEILMLCLSGMLLTVIAVTCVGGMSSQGLLYTAIFMLCFLIGSIISVARIVSVNVMSIMKAKE